VLQGAIQEVRYGSTPCSSSGCLPVTSDVVANAGDTVYVDGTSRHVNAGVSRRRCRCRCHAVGVCRCADSMGFHKVGNPTDEVSVTLHLYAPPFKTCRVWFDAAYPEDFHKPTVTYFSEFGELVEDSTSPLCSSTK
jgi:hypothetical protein